MGGSNSLGTWGYVEAVREIAQQLEAGQAGGADGFDDVIMACGSGGTTAGVALAAQLSGMKAKVHGYGVCDDEEYFYEYIQVGRCFDSLLVAELVYPMSLCLAQLRLQVFVGQRSLRGTRGGRDSTDGHDVGSATMRITFNGTPCGSLLRLDFCR